MTATAGAAAPVASWGIVSRPSRSARRRTVSVPPGGHKLIASPASTIAAAYGRHPGYPHCAHWVCGRRSLTRSTSYELLDGSLRAANPRPRPAISAMTVRVSMAIHIRIHGTQRRAMPEKPMKARDIMPAVIRAIAGPRNGAGTSAASRRSRIAANMMSTSAKPPAAPRP